MLGELKAPIAGAGSGGQRRQRVAAAQADQGCLHAILNVALTFPVT